MNKIYQFLIICLITFNSSAQSLQSTEDLDSLRALDVNETQFFIDFVKSKNYEDAYKPWMSVRLRNPKYTEAIYVNKYGVKILQHKIKTNEGLEKLDYINDLINLYEEYIQNFPNKIKNGDILGKIAKTRYDYRNELGLTVQELYSGFDIAFKRDLKTFNNPLHLYTYFKLMVKLFDNNIKTAEELFTKYDEILEKVENEIKNYTAQVNKFISTSDDEIALSSKDQKRLNSYNSYLSNYDKIMRGMSKDIGDRGNCENLIPLYENNFDVNKNDTKWLSRAMNRLYKKECVETELYIKIVKQKVSIEPDAKTAFYLGNIKDKQGDSSEALVYYNQAIELENDSYEKAKILFLIAQNYRKKGSYSKARSYYNQALDNNPSMGQAHLAIASMYAKSANRCGDSNFNKRAVFWLAAKEAAKAGRVDSKLKKDASRAVKSYNSNAPQKSEVFSEGRAGESIRIGCWIGRTIRVPNL